ncbi:MAG: 2'-5' RNA ligase family protein [Pseudonocardiaceae bacterium]
MSTNQSAGSKEGRTGLVIPVPAADPLLASVAARYPGTVREGVGAHVSLLYPFVPAPELDQDVTDTLSELFAGQPWIPVTFTQCRRSQGFVFLRPEPVDELKTLTKKARRRWPGVDGGRAHDDVGPHLTVAMGATEQAAATIEREVTAALPISARLREVWLVAFDGKWGLRSRFELAPVRRTTNR